MKSLAEDVAAGGGLATLGNQVNDRCQSYLPPGPQVSFGLSLSSVSADNVLHTTIRFNIHYLALNTAHWKKQVTVGLLINLPHQRSNASNVKSAVNTSSALTGSAILTYQRVHKKHVSCLFSVPSNKPDTNTSTVASSYYTLTASQQIYS